MRRAQRVLRPLLLVNTRLAAIFRDPQFTLVEDSPVPISALRPRLMRALVVGISLALAVSCGDSSGPGDGGNGPQSARIAIDDTISRQWSGDSIDYYLRPANAAAFAVYGKATGQSFIIDVLDSASGAFLTQVGVPTDPNSTLRTKHTRVVERNAGQTAVIRVRRFQSGIGSFTIAVARVQVAPEITPATIQPGDSVTSETMSEPVDLDRFYFHAGSELELALFGQSLGGYVGIVVKDSSTGAELGAMGFFNDPAPDHLRLVRSEPFTVPAGVTGLVEVGQVDGPLSGGYKFWLYPVNRAPEDGPGVIALNDTIAETLETSADVDEFTVTVPAGAELIGYYRGVGVDIGSPILSISGAGVTPSFPSIQHALSTELEDQDTDRFVSTTGGVLTVTVRNQGIGISPLTYALMVRTINRQPEHVPAVIAANDTIVGESIDYVGDIDEFTLATAPGEIWNGFIHALSIPGSSRFALRIYEGSTQLAQTAVSMVGNPILANQFTGNLESSGSSLRLAVDSPHDFGAKKRGAYRIFAYHVNPLPELVAPTIAAGDSVLAETIEFPGDIDSFTVTPVPGTAVSLVVERPNSLALPLAFRWLGSNGAGIITCYPNQSGSQARCASGTINPPPPGQWVKLGGDSYRGGYGLFAYSINLAPEGVNPVITLGDTVSTVIDPVGDVDHYSLNYQRGQLLDIWATGGGCSTSNSIIVGALDFQNIFQVYANCGVRTGRFELPMSGTYTIRATGYNGGLQPAEVGPYRFVVMPYPTTPEHVSSALAPGDSIQGEAFDEPGDVDDFLLTASPGTELQVLPRYAYVSVRLPGDSINWFEGRNSATGRFLMPAGGQVVIRIALPRGFGPDIFTAFGGPGSTPYDIRAYAINRAPEHLPASINLATDIVGEDLPYEGEVDEFTFQGTAGQVVEGSLSSPQAFSQGNVLLQILDPTGTSVLGIAASHDGAVDSTGAVTLPVAGTYIVRIHGDDDTVGVGAYVFRID